MTETNTEQPLIEQVYRFIQRYSHEQGGSPSYREIASGCFIAYSTVVRLLEQLEAQGRIQRVQGQNRSIRLVDERGEDTAEDAGEKIGSKKGSYDRTRTEQLC